MATYSDKDKAAALALLDVNGGNIAQTSRDTGIPYSTLRGWANNKHINEDVAETRDHKKGEIADRLESLIHDILDVVPDKLDQDTAKNLMTSLGIAVDKLQLLRGEATARHESSSTVEGSVTFEFGNLPEHMGNFEQWLEGDDDDKSE